MNGLCFHIGNVIIPTGFHIFQRGRYTTNQLKHLLFLFLLFKQSISCFFPPTSPTSGSFLMSICSAKIRGPPHLVSKTWQAEGSIVQASRPHSCWGLTTTTRILIYSRYPPVNVDITLENHIVPWVIQLFRLLPFSIANC